MTTTSSLDLDAIRAHSDEASGLLRAMANAQRLRILCFLGTNELTVSQLNALMPELSQSALSQHLARLRKQGLVATRHEAQSVWYALAEGPVQALIATLHGIYCKPAPVRKC